MINNAKSWNDLFIHFFFVIDPCQLNSCPQDAGCVPDNTTEAGFTCICKLRICALYALMINLFKINNMFKYLKLLQYLFIVLSCISITEKFPSAVSWPRYSIGSWQINMQVYQIPYYCHCQVRSYNAFEDYFGSCSSSFEPDVDALCLSYHFDTEAVLFAWLSSG